MKKKQNRKSEKRNWNGTDFGYIWPNIEKDVNISNKKFSLAFSRGIATRIDKRNVLVFWCKTEAEDTKKEKN